MSVGFHSGELTVQRRAGVDAQAARLSGMVGRGELRGGVAAVLAEAPFAAITARDGDGRLWISPLTGQPGFLDATTPTRLSVRSALPAADPLHGLDADQPIGVVAMNFAAKRRARINGTLADADGVLEVDVEQAYGNCPQYIRPRQIGIADSTGAVRVGSELETADVALVRSADTFFLGTTHAHRGNDASHRGGPPGFVQADSNTVEWPDYPGNNMFNSLGNLALDPTAALLFVDFDSGRTLQLSGQAHIVWDAPGDGDSGRRVRFVAERVIAR